MHCKVHNETRLFVGHLIIPDVWPILAEQQLGKSIDNGLISVSPLLLADWLHCVPLFKEIPYWGVYW